MTTYNGSKFIYDQLLSISNQTIRPDEIVVCDDASTDNTVNILMSFSKKVNFPIKIIKNKFNIGYSNSFNKALSLCEGEIVFICDQDDFWFREKIEKVLNCFENNIGIVLVIHDVMFCREDLSPIGQTKINRIKSFTNVENDYVVGMATAIKRDFLQLCLPIPNLSGISYDRWLHDCARVIKKKFVLNSVLAYYRRHSENVTSNSSINANHTTSKISLLWAKFRESSNVKNIKYFESSQLASWIIKKKDWIVMNDYLSESEVINIISSEESKLAILRERSRILKLPRWKRGLAILKLLSIGGYTYFFGWKSAIKDLLTP